MPATRIFEGFSISNAAILASTDGVGTTGVPEAWGDIYGVRQGSISVDQSSYDNTGDDFVLSTWFWFNFANISIQSGYVPFDTIAALSGATQTSSGSGSSDYYSLPLWQEDALNQPTRPMIISVPSKDSAGVSRQLDFILYKVQFQPFNFTGPQYKDGLLIDYSGRALISDKNERGQTLAKKAIGRLVNRPAGTSGVY